LRHRLALAAAGDLDLSGSPHFDKLPTVSDDASGEIWDAETYDAPRRRLVPDFDQFYGTAADLVADLNRPEPDVLDLGAGTGLLAEAVRATTPAARLTLLDGSSAMLAVAGRRLGASVPSRPVVLVEGDLSGALPAGPFDAVVSALAIHHLGDGAKQDLFRRVRAVLRAGGVFVNAEQVAGPTSWHDEQYATRHERDARRLGSDDVEWAGAVERMAHDRCATADDQLRWLREAGFERVDLAYKRYRFAVYAGYAPS
jgi:tRNA (cmo5U34)-methyltransferase